MLELALSNLVETALKHADASDQSVHVRAAAGDAVDAAAVIEVSDTNPQIPEAEIAVPNSDSKTPLEHGQGIGLWIVNWCVTNPTASSTSVRRRNPVRDHAAG